MPDGVRDKRVLVTGGSGFVGSRVAERLKEGGAAEVTVPRRRDYDLTHPDSVSRLIEDSRPETVIHLAAEVGGIRANRANPGRYFYTNMAVGLHLIEEARRCGIEKLVEVGTVAAYPKNAPVPFKEESLWDGYPTETHAPYAIAAKALLVMLQAYREQYGLNGIYLIPVNIYGPGDSFNAESSEVIPALIHKCEEARRTGAGVVDCWGTGHASREFLYVDDAAEAIVLATERYDDPEPVNIGSGSEVTIRELTELIAAITGYEGRLEWDPTQPEGHSRRRIDASRAKEKFGFEARVPLEEGLRRTVGWYRTKAAGAVPA